MKTYKTKYSTKFLTGRNGRMLRGPLVTVPVGTPLELLQKVATEHGRALFRAIVNGRSVYGYQDIDGLDQFDAEQVGAQGMEDACGING